MMKGGVWEVREGVMGWLGGLLGNLLRCIGGREENRRPVIASIQTEPTGIAGNSRGERANVLSRCE